MEDFLKDIIDQLRNLYAEKRYDESGQTRSTQARKLLNALELYFKHNPPSFEQIMDLLEAAYSGKSHPSMLDPYCRQAAMMAETTEEMFAVWDMFPAAWREDRIKLTRKILATDSSVQTYSRLVELLLKQI